MNQALDLLECHIDIQSRIGIPLLRSSSIVDAPAFRWTGTHNDLIELCVALCELSVFVNSDGRCPRFGELLRFLCRNFGVDIPDMHTKRVQVMDRVHEAPFIDRLKKAFLSAVCKHLK